MATRVFADEELARLRKFPEISREELFRFFTLSPADAAFIDPGRGRGPAERLGMAIALCTLPWLGFVPGRVNSAPTVAVARLAEQLKVDAGQIRSHGTPSARSWSVWISMSCVSVEQRQYPTRNGSPMSKSVPDSRGFTGTVHGTPLRNTRDLGPGLRRLVFRWPIGLRNTKPRTTAEDAAVRTITDAFLAFDEACGGIGRTAIALSPRHR
ncbi:DUF4158 domain-containing protein [Nocardia sp. NBC_00881]|nr:DUF4158 domain-containing protein [Nocardia sp. NBC_00881]